MLFLSFNVSSASELESLCRVLDNSEADCIFLVGGDGTLSRALVGLSQNSAPLPIGLFPGGRKNIAFWRIFQPKNQNGDSKSVRVFCESAMALIEGENRLVYPVKCSITEEMNDLPSDHQTVNTPNTFWLLSDLCAGWFEHCEQKAPKLWWWGPLRYKFVYFWEFLKRKPIPLDLRISYDEFCPGCKRCVPPIKQKNLTTLWSFFSHLLWSSPPENSKIKVNSDFAMVENPNCGQRREANVSGANVRLNVEQTENGSKLRLRVGGAGNAFGRWAAMRFGWNSMGVSNGESKRRENERDAQFYVLDIEASRLELQFTSIPDFVQKLSLAGEWGEFEQYESKKIALETTKAMGDHQNGAFLLHFYVPKLPLS
ncbi:hypothetical protein niasHT_002335 [Heterodera trifolii]|uniref:DAGKc domain-containing protein n=1 Tax=Heterodera trifolii TaxID=157864 RepID=A0ABD2LLW2_9BILA